MTTKRIKQIKREINNKNAHKKYRRRISTPKGDFNKHVQRPFQEEFKNGNFRNDIYFAMSPTFIARVYIKNILLCTWPALLLHGIMFGTHCLLTSVVGDVYTAPAEAFQLLFIAYAICLFFAFRKINDHMALYNITMLVSKYNINQKFLTMVYRSPNVEENREVAVMDHYRKKFNKYSLFPSKRELALEEQQYQRQKNSKKESVRQFAEMRRQRLSINSKKEEHIAAKEIADWKQARYGGENEYDVMVAKYKYRTVPAIREIIDGVKHRPNYNV